ncbi:hypothetical protein [uncultured Streptococcus sp.]|uniref:hypothetical protein n=1 Tax=uncultured Streptococcus sp. TaxID=83427 RepID=UPI0028D72DC6|nr:hypothetical protein [uncultured Streptococcus sp.]
MSYTMNLYPDFEERPDKPYFTKEIFLAMCMNNTAKLATARGILAGQLLDNKVRELVYKTIDAILEDQKDIFYGVLSEQITFLNKSKGEEELNESIRE